jgi:hypothetical protein
VRAAFIAKYVPAGADGQVRSVAGRFALIGAAGELARDYGVLLWPEGEALCAAGACFAAWLTERGGTGSGEDTAALAQVLSFLEAHGESRFTLSTPPVSGGEPSPPEVARTINRAGFRRRTMDGDTWEYLILPEAWRGEICKGLDSKRTAEMLAGLGLMVGGTDRHRAQLVRLPTEGPGRVYVVSGAILGDDQGGGGMTTNPGQNPTNAAIWSRNLALAHACPRCGARTRAGVPCKAQAMRNGRWHRHGGATTGPRTPEGLQRLVRAHTTHGAYSAESRQVAAMVRDLKAKAKRLVELI